MNNISSIENSLIVGFSKILIKLAQDERLSEISRQLLSQDFYFDPLFLFQYINKQNDYGGITYESFANFLNNDLNLHSQPMLSMLFTLYANDGNIITFELFENIFYPKCNVKLKRIVQERLGNSQSKKFGNATLPLIKKLFERELSLVNHLWLGIRKLKENNTSTFTSTQNLFNTLMYFSTNPRGLIDDNFSFLLSYSKVFFSSEDINAIMRRIDFDSDNCVTYDDINKVISSLEINREYLTNANSYSTNHMNYQSGLKLRPSPYMSNTSPNSFSNLKQIIRLYFASLLDIEAEIEKSKINLALRADYTIKDIFFLIKSNVSLLSSQSRITLSKEDFSSFLLERSSLYSHQDISLLMKRGDLVHKGYIDQSDFFDLVTPFEKEYRDLVEKRISYNTAKEVSQGTMIYLMNLFDCIIKSERKINNVRESMLSYKEDFCKIFNEISGKEKEFFTVDNLYDFFCRNNIVAYQDKKFKLVFIRLDRNRTGKVELFEFLDELTYII